MLLRIESTGPTDLLSWPLNSLTTNHGRLMSRISVTYWATSPDFLNWSRVLTNGCAVRCATQDFVPGLQILGVLGSGTLLNNNSDALDLC